MTLPRQRSPNRDKAFEIWLASGKTILLKDIAAQLGVGESQIRKWKNQDQWEKVTLPKAKSNVTKKVGAPKGNKNAVGHGAPLENKNAEKHGFFSKWLPPETLEIVQDIRERSPVELLWDQIELQYAAIIRAQKLMFVKDQQDKTKELISESAMGEAWDVQQAWDKHANFLSAQSRAMTTLNGLIKQYEDMLQRDDEAEDIKAERQARIAKIQAETARITENDDDDDGVIIFGGELLED